MNKVILIGNLGRDPETHSNGVTTFNLATTNNKTTQWHRIVCFKQNAQFAAQYFKKGSLVLIEGSIQYREYSDKNGKNCQVTEIIADSVSFVGTRNNSNENAKETKSSPSPYENYCKSNGISDKEIEDELSKVEEEIEF